MERTRGERLGHYLFFDRAGAIDHARQAGRHDPEDRRDPREQEDRRDRELNDVGNG
jgi:hypothetical protein